VRYKRYGPMLQWINMKFCSNTNNYLNKGYFNFIFLNSRFLNLSIMLISNSHKIIIKLKYGLFHYFFWLKVGCRNIEWRFSLTVFFLLDFVFSSNIWQRYSNFFLSSVKYRYLPVKKSIFTLSKGPLVRKKQSREQYAFKQIFINIKKIISLVYTKDIKELRSGKSIKYSTLFNQLEYLEKKLNIYPAHLIFPFFNSNSIHFIVWLNNFKNLPLFLETNIFFLKNVFSIFTFCDLSIFYL
jgi:hypothetical protein